MATVAAPEIDVFATPNISTTPSSSGPDVVPWLIFAALAWGVYEVEKGHITL